MNADAGSAIECIRCGAATRIEQCNLGLDGTVDCPRCGHRLSAVVPNERVTFLNADDTRHPDTVFVISTFRNCGSVTQLYEQVALLVGRGHSVSVISLNGGGQWLEHFRSLGVETIVSFGFSWTFPQAWSYEGTVVLHNESTIKWSNFQYFGARRVIAWLHTRLGVESAAVASSVVAALRRGVSFRFPTQLLMEAYSTRVGELPHGSELGSVFPNRMVTAGYEAGPESSASYDGTMAILCVSRLDPDKVRLPDVEVLVNAATDLGLDLVFAGTGSLLPALVDRFEGPNATFLGYVEDVRPWYQRASLVVLPSYTEVFPAVVVESAIFGRRCLTMVGDFLVEAPDEIRASTIVVSPWTKSRVSQAICAALQADERTQGIESLADLDEEWESRLLSEVRRDSASQGIGR